MFERVIADQARTRPNAVAFVDGHSVADFSEMADDIARCTEWLTREKCSHGERVVVHVSSIYQYWVLFFAIEAVGAISIGVNVDLPLGALQLAYLRADRYVTDSAVGEELGLPGTVLNDVWLLKLRSQPIKLVPTRARSGEDPICIVLSSGTTGQPKKVLLTRQMIDLRAINEMSSDFIHAGARIHQAFPNHSIGALVSVISIWAVGATLGIQEYGDNLLDLWTRLRPTVVMGAPTHFARIMGELPDQFAADPPIHAQSGGGVMPDAIAMQIGRKLRGRVAMTYASTEMGYVARADHHQLKVHDGAVGVILPYARVEIRDDRGNVLPQGEIGQVWVSGGHVADGFLDDPEQTAASFDNGWFHPGDLGLLTGDGHLVVHARSDDLINFRGRKMLARSIEDKVLALVAVTDVAVFMAPRSTDPEPVIWIVYQAGAVVDPRDMMSAVPRGVPFAVARIDMIPRNAMGKIERAALRERATAGEFNLERSRTGTISP